MDNKVGSKRECTGFEPDPSPKRTRFTPIDEKMSITELLKPVDDEFTYKFCDGCSGTLYDHEGVGVAVAATLPTGLIEVVGGYLGVDVEQTEEQKDPDLLAVLSVRQWRPYGLIVLRARLRGMTPQVGLIKRITVRAIPKKTFYTRVDVEVAEVYVLSRCGYATTTEVRRDGEWTLWKHNHRHGRRWYRRYTTDYMMSYMPIIRSVLDNGLTGKRFAPNLLGRILREYLRIQTIWVEREKYDTCHKKLVAPDPQLRHFYLTDGSGSE